MKKTTVRMLLFAFALLLCVSGSAYAFQDVEHAPDRDKLDQLRSKGILTGIGNDKFDPNGQLTYAQGIAIIVKGFELNLDHIQFVKEPLAQDYYENVPNDAWYAHHFIVAHHNGIELPKDVDPNVAMTREAFVHSLVQAMLHKAVFPIPKIYIMPADEAELSPEYRATVQTALIVKIAKMDEDGNFYPKREVTRLEAALMLHDAVAFIEKYTKPIEDPGTDPDEPVTIDDKVTMAIEPVTDEVNKVVIRWGRKPNSGYTISIDRVEFRDGKAMIHYDLHYPQDDMSYLTVITEPTAVTYVSSAYTPEIVEINPEKAVEPDTES